ncbi:MAG: hypothetical protein QOG54_925 [Actinomycetota bacterium]|jgi:hypothetical protein|nr:hypothetical protein [Actinomycetota bacterium]
MNMYGSGFLYGLDRTLAVRGTQGAVRTPEGTRRGW